jgi:hypothetical protein
MLHQREDFGLFVASPLGLPTVSQPAFLPGLDSRTIGGLASFIDPTKRVAVFCWLSKLRLEDCGFQIHCSGWTNSK